MDEKIQTTDVDSLNHVKTISTHHVDNEKDSSTCSVTEEVANAHLNFHQYLAILVYNSMALLLVESLLTYLLGTHSYIKWLSLYLVDATCDNSVRERRSRPGSQLYMDHCIVSLTWSFAVSQHC